MLALPCVKWLRFAPVSCYLITPWSPPPIFPSVPDCLHHSCSSCPEFYFFVGLTCMTVSGLLDFVNFWVFLDCLFCLGLIKELPFFSSCLDPRYCASCQNQSIPFTHWVFCTCHIYVSLCELTAQCTKGKIRLCICCSCWSRWNDVDGVYLSIFVNVVCFYSWDRPLWCCMGQSGKKWMDGLLVGRWEAFLNIVLVVTK